MFRATALNALRHPSSCALYAPRCARLSLSRYLSQNQFGTSRNFSSSRPPSAVHYVRFGGGSNHGKRPSDRFNKKYLVGIGAVGAAYYVSHLEQVPETGRWRFMNTGRAYEEKIGKMLRDSVLEEHQHRTLPQNHVISRHVRRVVTQILTASNLGHIRGESSLSHFVQPMPSGGHPGEEAPWDPDTQRGSSTAGAQGHERVWEVVVVNDNRTVNAMAAPVIQALLGLIVVFTGILPVCKDEKGLSAVLSHVQQKSGTSVLAQRSPRFFASSLAAVARHTAESISSQTITLAVLFLAQVFGLDFGLTSLAQELIFNLPNSRKMELEADKIGLQLMSRACFDPKGAVEMFERMSRMDKSRVDFFNTHPSGTKRVEELQKLLPEAYGVLNANPDCAAVQDRLQSFREVALHGPDFQPGY
ncbi:hypothetical protein DXG01_004120 [Tephrocybe rancida]|nr:hypothetical protein DXG01_004120 [Tephrocybe rancida]